MDVLKIYSDADFANVVVPTGKILAFTALIEGKLVTRFKNSAGEFGTLAGGGGGSTNVVVSLTQPSSPSDGMIWIQEATT